ncbi:MAG: hypothetical protein GVY19_03065 [Bacteroidetes bacterium]|nr:hypothetical protein [Bacteroidota bacterium]
MKKIQFLLLALLLVSCEDQILIQFLDPDLIFPRAIKIDVDPYQYTHNGDSIVVFGDSLFNVDSICDTLTNEPFLKWDPTNAPFVVAAIFKNPPVISADNMNILNPGDITWIWHSGLEADDIESREGEVFYSDGKYPDDENADFFIENFKAIPKPLNSNTVYYWGIWGWNSEGREVNYASYPLKFFVK